MSEYNDLAQFETIINDKLVNFKNFTNNRFRYQKNRNAILSQLYGLSADNTTQENNPQEFIKPTEIPPISADMRLSINEPEKEPEEKIGILSGLSSVLTSNKQHSQKMSRLPKQSMPSVFQSAVEKRQQNS